MTRITTAALALCTAALAACGGGSGGYSTVGEPPPPPVDDHTVSATAALAFTPDSLKVTTGQAVTFAFGSVAHNVFFTTQDGAPTDIAGATANASVQRTFNTPGVYHYTCHIHPSMHGEVVVQ